MPAGERALSGGTPAAAPSNFVFSSGPEPIAWAFSAEWSECPFGTRRGVGSQFTLRWDQIEEAWHEILARF